MRDQLGREVDTLRIAVTGKNSYPALYSLDFSAQEKEELSVEELEAVVKAAASLGVKKIKIIGGEPMEREDIVSLVEKIAAVEGIENISMNTNGMYLKDKAEELKKAGLNRVNILLDTFFEEKYIYITGGGRIDEAVDGMEAAVNAGLRPVRINAMIMKGFNDDELLNFAQVALNEPIDIKFIQMDSGANGNGKNENKEKIMANGKDDQKSNGKTRQKPNGKVGEKSNGTANDNDIIKKNGKNDTSHAFESMTIDEMKNKFKGLIGVQNQTASGLFYIWGEGKGKLGFVSPETARRPEISGKLELTCDGVLKTDITDAEGKNILESIKTKDVDKIKQALEAASC